MSDNSKTAESFRFSDLARSLPTARRSTVRDVVYAWWETSRMEYLPDAVVHIALPLLLVLRREPWSSDLLALSLLGLLVWLIGHWTGSSLNCLADYPVDRLDVGHKARLAAAIDQAGGRAILLVNLAEIALATVVSAGLSLRLGKPLLLVFWLAGLLVAYLYSFAPAHFKRRNFLNPAALTLIVYALPLFFAYHLLSPAWALYDVAILAVYCLQMTPMFLVDEVSDHDEDRAMGIRNPCVTYGRVWTSGLANGIYVTACLASLALFAAQSPYWSAGRAGVFALALLAYLWVVREFVLLARFSRAIDEALNTVARAERTQALKRFSKTPAWLVATSIGALLLAIGEAFL